MKKVYIYYGSKEGFEKAIEGKEYRTLGSVVSEYDKMMKTEYMQIVVDEVKKIKYNKDKIELENLVIFSDEYVSVREHVIQNFIAFLDNFNLEEIYLHNPQDVIVRQLERAYESKMITVEYQEYKKIDINHIKKFDKEYDNVVIGQPNVKATMTRTLYQLIKKQNDKPIILMFYGLSGVGKTETAKFISQIISQPLFRKQFSMFQNNDFLNYLYGGKYNENSFAKDLLERTSNIILLDEFDKAPNVFSSAFYQMFDEGIYKDKNYTVNLKNSIIICTSNYLREEEIKKELSAPLYYRFDEFIKFNKLSEQVMIEITNRRFSEYTNNLSEEENLIISDSNALLNLQNYCKRLDNARQVEKMVNSYLSKILIEKILEIKE